MSGELITVFGGSGFVGKYVVRDLCRKGYRVRVAVRNPHVAGDQRLAGDVGQVQIVQANVRNRPSIERAVEGAYAVINLVGILYEKGAQTFNGTQELGAKNVAEIAAAEGVQHFVHMSAIGADKNSEARYAQTKADAEEAVRAHMPNAVIIRPSIIFGQEDEFFNRFADMAKTVPVLPSIGGGTTKFQPVYVGDVAKAIVSAIETPDAAGRVFELGGPETYTFKEVLEYILETTDRKALLLPLPFWLAGLIGLIMGGLFKLWPFSGPPLTNDQVQMLKTDNVVNTEDDTLGTFRDLGMIELETVESIVPEYLWRYRTNGQFHEPSQA